jgi:ribosomal protein S18 acetylase RimI-like enzyme
MRTMKTSTSTSTPNVSTLTRVLSFVHENLAKTADNVRPIEAGCIVSTPSLPAVWSVNQIRVARPLAFEALIELAEEQLATRYVHIVSENQETGPEAEQAFRGAGWKTEREVWMVLGAEPDRATDTSAVVDAGEDEVAELMRRWFAEEELDAGALDQLVEFSRREARACADRLLGVRSSDGHLVAVCKLRSDGRTAQVEDVYTAPEARGRGFGRAVVARGVELAREDGHDVIFITADDNDWPKELYGRIGFRPLGRIWQFHHD